MSPTPSTRSPPTGTARDRDYYQILAYTRVLDVPAGMLIYCQRDGDTPPTSITVGADQVRLDTSALALTGTPADIEQRLQALADQITQKAGLLPAISGQSAVASRFLPRFRSAGIVSAAVFRPHPS